MEPITIKDVARLCGVGVSTVSRAINNHPDINPETREMVMQVIREHNYIPNNSARNLKRSDSRTIAVLIKGIGNPFFSKMIKVFEEEIQRKKYTFVLQRVDQKEDEVDIALELVKEKRLKGIVFLGGYFSHSAEKLEQITVPYVLSTIAMAHPAEGASYSSVSVDDLAESRRMTDYLCEKGHRDIAILAASPDDESIGSLRLAGYREALRGRNIPVREELIFASEGSHEIYTMENGYALMERALDSGEQFSAVYAISDSIAIGACKAAFDRGLRIPEDLSVAGFDGLDFGRFYNPTLTTVRQPVEEMAVATIRILFDLIKNKGQNQNLIFPGELTEGQSVKAM